MIDYREWIRKHFEHLVVTRHSPVSALSGGAPGTPNVVGNTTKYMPIQLLPSTMLPAGALTGQQQQIHLIPHLYHHQQQQQHHSVAMSSMRHRRVSTSSGDDSEDSKECDADSTSPSTGSNTHVIVSGGSGGGGVVLGGPAGNMATSANIHTAARMDT